MMEEAAAALSDSALPGIGIFTSCVHLADVSSVRPLPSFPMRYMTGSVMPALSSSSPLRCIARLETDFREQNAKASSGVFVTSGRCHTEEFETIPKIQTITYVDPATDVTVTYPETAFEDGVQIVVEPKTDGPAFEITDLQTSNFVVYDIKAVKNGVEIQPSGALKVAIPVPADYDSTKCVVYRVEGSSLVNMNATFENGFMTFTTDHFSDYVLAVPKATASYTIDVYTMDTTGAYQKTSSTATATVGSEVSVNAADYESAGLTVNTATSKLSATLEESGTVLTVYVDRAQVTYSFKVYDYAANDGTYLSTDVPAYYGAQVLPPLDDPQVEGYDFVGWFTADDAPFASAVAGLEDVEIFAKFEKQIDPSQAASAEEIAALNAAIATLVDPHNLAYYTDEAIMDVCNTLGGGFANADEYITYIKANGYKNNVPATSVAVTAATDRINNVLMATGANMTEDSLGYIGTVNGIAVKTNRDESKAHLTVSMVPVAINDEEITSTNYKATVIQPGDTVKFALELETDYFVSVADMPIVDDSTRFRVMDIDERQVQRR